MPAETTIPELLSETGLYSDPASKTVAPYMRRFSPQNELWTDGATKTRWIYLPECTQIDNSVDPSNPVSGEEHWRFPVGTRVFKEFRFGPRRVETRMILRWGEGIDDWIFTAYQWDAEENDATRVPGGVQGAANTGLTDGNGTPITHDIPSEFQCRMCHGGYNLGGRPARLLGFSALQLSHGKPDSETILSLSQEGLLTAPVIHLYSIPGTATERDALGYLHANCGHCHNNAPGALTALNFNLWVDTGLTDVKATGTYQTAVCKKTTSFEDAPFRVAPLQLDNSCVSVRMGHRGSNEQMPPLGTNAEDISGLWLMEQWIASFDPADECPDTPQ